ncbi:hypothetical protein ACIRN4_06170 [Pimelobacter simplex]|uniref:hypothetical protein n=1 Tax=Nocardioides simplex TaxID=2045 RepID=UPI0038027E7D
MSYGFPTGTRSPFARAVSAEVRARMAARRLGLRELSLAAGFGSSHNYLAKRLRDAAPLTVDDVEAIARYFGESAEEFIERACVNFLEQAVAEMDEANAPQPDDEPEEIAAHDSDGTIADEQEAPDFP